MLHIGALLKPSDVFARLRIIWCKLVDDEANESYLDIVMVGGDPVIAQSLGDVMSKDPGGAVVRCRMISIFSPHLCSVLIEPTFRPP